MNDGPTTPSVSVIVPTLNRSEACERAVWSALRQCHPPLEVLVCDDGSHDDTTSMLRRLAAADTRVRIVEGPRRPTGPGSARNRGILAAHGDLVAFLDDDDYWEPEKLARQVPAWNPGTIVCANAQTTSRGPYFDDGAPRAFGLEDALVVNPVITSTALVARRDLARVGGFSEARVRQGVEDYDLWLRLLDTGCTIRRLPQMLITYEDSAQGRLSNRNHLARETLMMAERWTHAPTSRHAQLAVLDRTRALGSHAILAATRVGRRNGDSTSVEGGVP